MSTTDPSPQSDGLSLQPIRGLRPAVDDDRLGRLLCPPYDVIDDALRARLLDGDVENAVAVVLPDPTPAGYADAADRLRRQVRDGLLTVDPQPTLYVYEMVDDQGAATRGLLGAVELRAPQDGVILPHENTMAGPVADRLAVMTATDTDLEPIYLIYDGGGAASQALSEVDGTEPTAQARTPDGQTHRLWSITDPTRLEAIASDLRTRRALIADGHHRYATYRERQRLRRAVDGAGPWDRGLALLVDSSRYGPQVHAIHRVVPGLDFERATTLLRSRAAVRLSTDSPEVALAATADTTGFHAVLTDGERVAVLSDPDGALADAARRPDEPAALAALDVTILHRAVVEQAWQLPDDVQHVGYAHSVAEAIAQARAAGGVAVLLHPTPADAVAAVAAEGARMPRKSTLFTPKPASGLVMRRLSDQG